MSSNTIKASNLRRALSRVLYAVKAKNPRPGQDGVLVELTESEARFVATDGHRLARTTIAHTSTMPGTVTLKLETVKKLVQDLKTQDRVRLHINYKMLVLSAGDGGMALGSYRTSCEDFPDYTQVIAGQDDYQLTVPRQELQDLVEVIPLDPASLAACALSDDLVQQCQAKLVEVRARHKKEIAEARQDVRTAKERARAHAVRANTIVMSEDADTGGLWLRASTRKSENHPTSATSNPYGEWQEVGISAKYLRAALKNIRGGNVTISGPGHLAPIKVVAECDGIEYMAVVMPVRID